MNFPEYKYLPAIWMSFFFIIVILAVINLFSSSYEILSFTAVFIHAVIVLIVLGTTPKLLRAIFIWAFLLRLFLLIWDLYARNIFPLPNSGRDSEMYYYFSIKIYEDISLISNPVRGGIYSKLIGTLFFIIGPMRMFAQYINVLLGLFVVITIHKTVSLLEINHRTTKAILLIAAFFPNSLMMSAIFIREIIPTFFVALSLYYCIRWYRFENLTNMLLSLVFLAIAILFHTGILGIFIGYSFFYLFYKKQNNKFQFNSQSIAAFAFIACIALIAVSVLGDSLYYKFREIEEMEDVFHITNKRLGNSVYLTALSINSPVEMILYGPIKTFYFLTSPLPMNWRGSMDILTFIMDSVLFMWVILYFLFNRKTFINRRPLIHGIVLVLICVSFIYGIGVSNSGTAVRHRQKLVPLFTVLYAVMLHERKDFNATIFRN